MAHCSAHVFARRTVAWCAAAIFIVSPFLRAFNYRLGHFSSGAHTWLTADGLAIGALLGVLSRGSLTQRKAMRNFSRGCILGALLLFGFGARFGIWNKTVGFGTAFRPTAVNLFFAGVLGATLLVGSSRWKWLVRRPLLQWFGEISYGLYLVHELVFDFVNHWIAPQAYAQLPWRFDLVALRFCLAVPLAVLVAYLSRRYFEERFLRLKDRWAGTTAETRTSPTLVEKSSGPVQQSA